MLGGSARVTLSLRGLIATTLGKTIQGFNSGTVRRTSLNLHFEEITMANCRKQTCQVSRKTDFYHFCGKWYNCYNLVQGNCVLSFDNFRHAYNGLYYHTPPSPPLTSECIPYLSTPLLIFF